MDPFPIVYSFLSSLIISALLRLLDCVAAASERVSVSTSFSSSVVVGTEPVRNFTMLCGIKSKETR